jgi:hypothetical protein
METSSERKTFVIDIDGTICSQDGANYETAQPDYRVIQAVNKLFECGHKIVYFTARGSTTEIDWRELTELQLNNWGAMYTELKLGKPYGDFYIDDKAIQPSDFLKKFSEYGSDFITD